jgi:hypothetical protein
MKTLKEISEYIEDLSLMYGEDAQFDAFWFTGDRDSELALVYIRDETEKEKEYRLRKEN